MANFSFSYSPSATAQPTVPNPLWSFNGIEAFPGPQGTSVLYRKNNSMRALVQNPVIAALMECSTFKTLEQHAQAVTQIIPELQGQYQDAFNTLKQIAEMGFAETADAAFKRLTGGAVNDLKTGIDAFIITCDRPEALSRLLISIKQSAIPPEVERLYVIDDSRDEENRRLNEGVCSEAASSLSCELIYFGLGQRQRLIQQLTDALPHHQEAIEFLLARNFWAGAPTYGLARNLALLLSVGRRAVVMDDDILCRAIAPPGASRGLTFTRLGDREAVLYPTREQLHQHELTLDQSPLSLAAPVIGSSLAYLIAQPGGLASPQSLAGLDGNQLDRYSGSSQALLMQAGAWGDSGSSRGSWLFFNNAASIKKIVSSDQSLKAQLEAQSAWLGFRGPTVTPYGSMSMFTGLDNRALLPPYLPAHRGEDLLFSLMLQRLHPTSFTFNAPWAVPHLPLEDRPERAALEPIQATPDISALAEWLGREPTDQWGQPPERSLSRLSEELRSLASMNEDASQNLLGAQLASRNASLLNRCMRLLDEAQHLPPTPALQDWSQFLIETRDTLIGNLQGPADIGSVVAAAGINTAQVKAMGYRFAGAVEAWADLREAARCLNP